MFEKNIFINCPFDDEYEELLRPLLFFIVYHDFTPQIANQTSDSSESRLQKICKLIKKSKYSIHDISRLRCSKNDEFYRLNMPFELGIDYAHRRIGQGRLQEKKLLVLEKERYDYQKALSDLAGSDIKHHGNEPTKIISRLRKWFVETLGSRGLKSPTKIWELFNEFMADFYRKRKEEGFSEEDILDISIPEFIDNIRMWKKDLPDR